MALYGPSLMQGLGGLIQGMGQGPIRFGQGRIVDGGWPGRQAPQRGALTFSGNARMEQVVAAMPDVFRMFAPPRSTPGQAALGMATAENLPMGMRWLGMPQGTQYGTHTTAGVISPGQTQVVRPSQQQPARRPSAPQAGASSSLMTEVPSPAEVALAITSLLGG